MENTTMYMLTETSQFMMSFVIVTKKDNVIIVDGGRPLDMPLLKEYVGGRHISAWILTHAHNDHISGFVDEMEKNGCADFDIETVYYSFPSYDTLIGRTDVPDKKYFDTELNEMLPAFGKIEPLLGERAHVVTQGEKILIDECEIEFIYTYHDGLFSNLMNDASLVFEPETSVALGFGFRCGFLGLLHMEIIEERLEREFNIDLITTAPSVIYKIVKKSGEEIYIDNPSNFPPPDEIDVAYEPMMRASVITPTEYVGNLMDLCQDRRGIFVDMKYIDTERVELHYILPLNEIIYDFFDALKSRSKGYASLDYDFAEYKQSKLVKLDFLLNGEQVDALSFIVFEDRAYTRARKITEKLKENIPRQLFEVPIQAAIGSKIIARETVKAMRKDVLAKCYGGDITRKKKLLEKQKEGKKKMRKLGSVEVTPEAFMAVLKLDDGN